MNSLFAESTFCLGRRDLENREGSRLRHEYPTSPFRAQCGRKMAMCVTSCAMDIHGAHDAALADGENCG